MKYFQFNSFCKYVYYSNKGCIYDTLSGDMFEVNNQITIILNKAINNQSLTNQEIKELKDLIDLRLGFITNSPIVYESPRVGFPQKLVKELGITGVLNHLYIYLNERCNLNCEYCNEDLIRQTGCKKKNLEKSCEKELDISEWEKIIREAKKFGIKNVSIMGGEPFLEKEKLFNLLDIINNIQISNIYIYTNLTLINHSDITRLCKYKNITIITDVISIEKDKYQLITGVKNSFEIFQNNIFLLKKLQFKLKLRLLVSKFNEDEIPNIINYYNRLGFNMEIKYVYYNGTDVDYSCKKNELKLFQKKKEFGKVTPEKLTINENYNSCLFGKITIDFSGNISICPMAPNIQIGSIYKMNFNQVLQDKKYIDIISISRDKIEKCKACIYKYNCRDCRAIETNNFKDSFDRLVYCEN